MSTKNPLDALMKTRVADEIVMVPARQLLGECPAPSDQTLVELEALLAAEGPQLIDRVSKFYVGVYKRLLTQHYDRAGEFNAYHVVIRKLRNLDPPRCLAAAVMLADFALRVVAGWDVEIGTALDGLSVLDELDFMERGIKRNFAPPSRPRRSVRPKLTAEQIASMTEAREDREWAQREKEKKYRIGREIGLQERIRLRERAERRPPGKTPVAPIKSSGSLPMRMSAPPFRAAAEAVKLRQAEQVAGIRQDERGAP